MKGWEIYKDGWGCGRDARTEWDNYYDKCWDAFHFNRLFCGFHADRLMLVFIRQPTPQWAQVDDVRFRRQVNFIKRQWLVALYDPGRALCRRRVMALFTELPEADRRYLAPAEGYAGPAAAPAMLPLARVEVSSRIPPAPSTRLPAATPRLDTH